MSQISPGQVLLLSRKVIAGEVRDFSVMVTSDWDGDAWVVAPVMAYPTPVYRGDIRTGLLSPLAVVSVNLSASVPRAAIERGLVIGEVSEQVCAAAWDLFRHVVMGIDLPDDLSARTGPPIESPYDPRIGGQDAWSAFMAGWAWSFMEGDWGKWP